MNIKRIVSNIAICTDCDSVILGRCLCHSVDIKPQREALHTATQLEFGKSPCLLCQHPTNLSNNLCLICTMELEKKSGEVCWVCKDELNRYCKMNLCSGCTVDYLRFGGNIFTEEYAKNVLPTRRDRRG